VITNVSHVTPGKYRPVVHVQSVAMAGDVIAGDYRSNARQRFSTTGVDRNDPRPRPITEEQLRMEHPLQIEIGAVLGRAGDLGLAIDASHRGTDLALSRTLSRWSDNTARLNINSHS